MANPTGSGPWKPCETGGFRGVIVGSVIDAAMDQFHNKLTTPICNQDGTTLTAAGLRSPTKATPIRWIGSFLPRYFFGIALFSYMLNSLLSCILSIIHLEPEHKHLINVEHHHVRPVPTRFGCSKCFRTLLHAPLKSV